MLRKQKKQEEETEGTGGGDGRGLPAAYRGDPSLRGAEAIRAPGNQRGMGLSGAAGGDPGAGCGSGENGAALRRL